jgi:hypothetical protein
VRSISLKADIAEDAQVRERTENAGIQLGRSDFVVVNAAATARKPLLAVKPRNLTRTFNRKTPAHF